MASYIVYIVRCRDGSFYTGWTNNLPARVARHNNGTGAKYTRGRGPVVVVYTKRCRSRSAAMRQERAIKGMSRAEKVALCAKRRK